MRVVDYTQSIVNKFQSLSIILWCKALTLIKFVYAFHTTFIKRNPSINFSQSRCALEHCDVIDAQKRVCGSVCMCVSEHVFVCATNTTNIKQRERERSRRDSSFNGKLHVIVIFDSLTVQEDYIHSHTLQHNVRFQLIYLSPTLRVLRYKLNIGWIGCASREPDLLGPIGEGRPMRKTVRDEKP